MVQDIALPAPLAELDERRTWFTRHDAERVLDWLEREGFPLLGMDTARKLADGNWMLLLDPMLDLGAEADAATSVQQGRAFLSEHTEPRLMFEPVWPGY